MSSTQKFSSSVEQEPQRIDHIEAVLPQLARLSEVLVLKEAFNSQAEQMKELSLKIDATLTALQSVKAGASQAKIELMNECRFLKDSHSCLDSKIASVVCAQVDHTNQLYSSSRELSETKMDVHSLEKRVNDLPSKASVECISDSLEFFRKRIDSILGEAKAPVSACMALVSELRVDLSALKEQMGEQARKYIDLLATCQDLQKKTEEGDKRLDSSLSSRLETLRDSLSSTISSIPVPSPSLSMSEVKKAILDALEPVSLDAKNAVLRSSNSDMKVSLLEKKVEQVNLLAKRFELTQ